MKYKDIRNYILADHIKMDMVKYNILLELNRTIKFNYAYAI